jgi:hypothetical protein
MPSASKLLVPIIENVAKIYIWHSVSEFPMHGFDQPWTEYTWKKIASVLNMYRF